MNLAKRGKVWRFVIRRDHSDCLKSVTSSMEHLDMITTSSVTDLLSLSADTTASHVTLSTISDTMITSDDEAPHFSTLSTNYRIGVTHGLGLITPSRLTPLCRVPAKELKRYRQTKQPKATGSFTIQERLILLKFKYNKWQLIERIYELPSAAATVAGD
eukprot:sb/3472996/